MGHSAQVESYLHVGNKLALDAMERAGARLQLGRAPVSAT